MIKQLLLLLLCVSGFNASAQPYTPAKTAWQNAGCQGNKPVFTKTINVMDHGADNAGTYSCNSAFNEAVNALNGMPGVILFPPGTYFFDAAISIDRDSLILRGAGYDSTTLRFNLSGQHSNLINVSG